MKIVITLGAEMIGTTAVVTKCFLWWFPRTTNWICYHVSPNTGAIWVNQESAERASNSLTSKLNIAARSASILAVATTTAEQALLRSRKPSLQLITSNRRNT